MKKLVVAGSLLLALTGATSAHAIAGTGIMDVEAGYGYSNAKDGIHALHVEVKPIPKVAVGAEYRHWNHAGNETDIYGKYKLGKVYLGVGARDYYNAGTKIYGLVEGRTKVLGPVDAYAGLKVSEIEREYKAGVNVNLVPTSFDVDLNYTYYDRDDEKNEDGFGIGLNYHF